MPIHNFIEIICAAMVVSALFLRKWKNLDKANRNLRRGYFILLSMVCVCTAIYTSYESFELFTYQSFTFRSARCILAAAGWWLISWGVVFRQRDFTKRLWR